MMDSQAKRMSCACGAWYAWSPDHADQTLRCACGRTLKLPGEAPTQDVELIDAGDDVLVDCRACPACLAMMDLDAAVCIECGFDRRQGRRTHVPQPRQPSRRELAMELTAAREQRNRRITALAVTFGCIIWLGILRPVLMGGWPIMALGLTLIWLVLGSGVLFGVTYVIRHMIDIEFESLGWLLVQLAAMYMAAHLIRLETIALFGLRPPEGGYIGAVGQALVMLAPLTLAFFILPGAAIYALGTYLMRPGPSDSLVVAGLFTPATVIAFAIAKLSGLPG